MGVLFTLHATPERWSPRDRAELRRALQAAGYEKTRGRGWLGPLLPDGMRLHVLIGLRPAAGVFRFMVDAEDWRRHPEPVARALTALVQLFAERTDVLYAAGPQEVDAPLVGHPGELTHLAPLTLLGPRLVGALELRDLPGFELDPVPGGGVLARPPFHRLRAEWDADLEARYLEAEMALGLRIDPARYPRLRGPAEGYVRRRFAESP